MKKHLWNVLYNRFPRQFAVPNRMDVFSMEHLYNLACQYGQTTRCYVSVYNYSYKNTKDVEVDKIVFDIDPSSSTFYEDTLKVSSFLESEGFKHIVVFSGGGFHIYVNVSPCQIDSKKCLMGFQRYVKEKTKTELDTSVFGDTARIIGLPFTYNFKRGKYVIPLNRRLLDSGIDIIKDVASNNNFQDYEVIGQNKVELKNFGSYVSITQTSEIIFDEESVKNMKDSLLNALPPCVQSLLIKGNLNHDERYFVISCMMEKRWSDSMIKTVLKKYLTDEKYHHCVLSTDKIFKGKKCEGQLDYVRKKFENPEWSFNSCRNIAERGWCVKPKCGRHPHDILGVI